MTNQHEQKTEFTGPGVRKIDDRTPIRLVLADLLGKVLHQGKDGEIAVDWEAEPLQAITFNGPNGKRPLGEHVETHDLDAVLETRNDGTYVVFGKWLVDHRRHIEAGAAVAILAAGTTAGIIGVVLRKHKRE